MSNFGDGFEGNSGNFITNTSHPVAAFFHIAFKIASIVLYELSGWVINSFVISFVVLIILLAADFWTVKNVSGRLLVGLRWWNDVKEDGTNVWIFESHPLAAQMPANDKRVFWTALYLAPVAWLCLAIVAFVRFNFDWLIICCVAIGLSAANVVGYTKCSSDAKNKAALAQGVIDMVRPTGMSLLSTAWGLIRGGTQPTQPQPAAQPPLGAV